MFIPGLVPTETKKMWKSIAGLTKNELYLAASIDDALVNEYHAKGDHKSVALHWRRSYGLRHKAFGIS